MDLSHWQYKEMFDPQDYFGFIYRITHILDNKFYIGRKNLYVTVTKPPLKSSTSKRKRKITHDSDWRTYISSSNELIELINMHGKGMFKFEILRLCNTKSEMNYFEVFYMIHTNSLTDPLGLNKQASKISCRPKII